MHSKLINISKHLMKTEVVCLGLGMSLFPLSRFRPSGICWEKKNSTTRMYVLCLKSFSFSILLRLSFCVIDGVINVSEIVSGISCFVSASWDDKVQCGSWFQNHFFVIHLTLLLLVGPCISIFICYVRCSLPLVDFFLQRECSWIVMFRAYDLDRSVVCSICFFISNSCICRVDEFLIFLGFPISPAFPTY